MFISGCIVLGFVFALVAPGLHRLQPQLTRLLLPLLPAGLALGFCTRIPAIAAGQVQVESWPWVPQLGLALSWRLDGLSLLFAILITGIGALVTLYAGWYLAKHPLLGRFYAFLFLFMGSMLGLVLADNSIALFVFWELTSLSSYFLIGFDHEREAARTAALQALLVTGTGGLAFLAAAVLLGQASGTFELSATLHATSDLRQHPAYPAIVLLVLTAAFTKSAQFPFHFWLPNAMEAPAPVSAYLHAATMVKAGVYLVARLGPILAGPPLWNSTLIGVGLLTAVLGASLALGERHFKRVLAYSTVSALGTMIVLAGVGTRAALWTMVLFLMAHALYKGALFLVAGTVSHATHESDAERVGGLRAAMPMTALAAGLAALSMGALPPFFGFLSKELLYGATLQAAPAHLLTGGLLVVNALFLAVAINVGIRPFWRGPAERRPHAQEAPWPQWAGPMLLALAGLLFGIWTRPVEGLLQAAGRAVAPGGPFAPLGLWHGFNLPLGLSVLTFLLGWLLYRARHRLRVAAAWLAPAIPYGPARGYTAGLAGMLRLAEIQTRLLQRGYLRGYLIIILTTAFVLIGYTVLARQGVPALGSGLDLRFYEGLLAILILAATLAAVRARSRFAAIISLGVVGYGVALFFVLFGAPDVGITQLVVETLTVVLLVLAFYHLPRFASFSSARDRIRDALVALGFGTLMTTLVLMAVGIQAPRTVAAYYGETSIPVAHGRNVVNVILTDARALDTLGEITVLATAAFGVVALLKLRSRGERV